MSKYLNVFNTLAEYQAFSASTEYVQPNVALVKETNVIYYDYGDNKPQADMSDFKVESQEISVGGKYYGCDAITKVHYIPTGITDLDYDFSRYPSLQEVTCEIPSGVTSMSQTFFWCQNLVKVPNIPSSVTNMNETFGGCTSLVNFPNIPSGVTEMSYTFYKCTSLVNAPEIPNSVTNMNYTFSYCTSLVNAPSIPNSVTNLDRTFYNCRKLKEVTFLHTTPPEYFDTLESCPKLETIYVPDASVDAYKTATGWSQFASKIKPLSSKPTA